MKSNMKGMVEKMQRLNEMMGFRKYGIFGLVLLMCSVYVFSYSSFGLVGYAGVDLKMKTGGPDSTMINSKPTIIQPAPKSTVQVPSVPVKITPEKYVVDGYDLNLLISDAEMADSGKYTLERVQKILERNQSILAKPLLVYRMTPSANVYSSGLIVHPAKLIVEAQNQYRISARVLLTMLQKEQSMLGQSSKQVLPNSRRMMFAMGYGALDSGDLLNMSGFDKQIMYAAKRLRAMINEAPKMYPLPMTINGGKSYTIAGRGFPGIVFVKNAATHALYRYTPYTVDPSLAPKTSGGNYLFAQIYRGSLVQ